jgi:hypothetical protein
MEAISKAKLKELTSDVPANGNVEIRLRDPKRTGSITLRDYTDSSGAHRPFVDQFGNARVLRITRTLYLDLSREDDRLTYEQVRLHPIFTNGARPVLLVVNHETEADSFVALKDMESQAMEIIQKLKGSELHDFARVLLVVVKPGSSDQVIKRALYEKATNDAGTILNEWNNELREFKSLLRKGIEQGVFIYKHGRYTFKDQLMGSSFDLAVDWIKDNEDLIPNLNKLIK